MISETVKFFTQCHAMQERSMQIKRANYSNIRNCSKWRPLIFTQQHRRLCHWSTASSMTLCWKPDHLAIRCHPWN